MGAKKSSKTADILVFWVFRPEACAECGTELVQGDLLLWEEKQPLCLACADLDHLVFLPSGDTALSRRAGKHSTLRAIVLKFSKARRRQERQGTLVEPAALERAEIECLEDDEVRRLNRERAAARRAARDDEYVEAFAAAIRRRYPAAPKNVATEIAEHACTKYSNRVGRTAAAKEFAEDALDLAVRAHVRHVETEYDSLLASGVDRREARARIESDVRSVLARWHGREHEAS